MLRISKGSERADYPTGERLSVWIGRSKCAIAPVARSAANAAARLDHQRSVDVRCDVKLSGRARRESEAQALYSLLRVGRGAMPGVLDHFARCALAQGVSSDGLSRT